MTDMEHDMTAVASAETQPQQSQPQNDAAPQGAAVVVLKPKNTHRLNRIFRKPKTTVVARKWHEDEDEDEGDANAEKKGTRRPLGIPLERLQGLLAGLTEAEKARAEAGLEPLSVTQEALAKRAERFGLPMDSPAAPKLPPSNGNGGSAFASPASAAAAAVPAVDAETLRRREARFKTAEQAEMEAAMERRLARFGQPATAGATQPAAPVVELQLSEADRAAMEARARRFAS